MYRCSIAAIMVVVSIRVFLYPTSATLCVLIAQLTRLQICILASSMVPFIVAAYRRVWNTSSGGAYQSRIVAMIVIEAFNTITVFVLVTMQAGIRAFGSIALIFHAFAIITNITWLTVLGLKTHKQKQMKIEKKNGIGIDYFLHKFLYLYLTISCTNS